MFKKWWEGWFCFDIGEPAGGGAGTAVAEAGEAGAEAGGEAEGTEAGEVAEGADGEEAQGEEGAESAEGQEAGEGEAGAEGTPSPKVVPLSALVEERRERAKLREKLENIERRLGHTDATVQRLTPPEKDALETWFEALPDGDPNSDKPGLKEAAELKQDAALMTRVMKDPGFRKAMLGPLLPLIQAMFRSLDVASFQSDANAEAFEALQEIFADDEKYGPRLKEKLPLAVRERKRLLKTHGEAVSGRADGAYVPVRDAFSQLTAQYEAEQQGTAAKVDEAAAAATKRTLREVSQRRTATGGPRSEAAPARGGTGKPGKMTPEQIDRSDKDFLV